MRGFSLLELSMVLIILALIISGVIAGQTLLRSAELRRVMEDADAHRKNLYAFRTKFEAYPGDFARASDVWAAADGGTGSTTSCYNVDSRTLTNNRGTCNGNGDGYIFSPNPTAVGTESNIWYYSERFRAWQQLASAGMGGGRLAGRTLGANSWDVSIEQNVPRGPLENSYWQFAGTSFALTSDPHYFDTASAQNILWLGGALLSPEEAAQIDSKLDDGFPATGKVLSFKSSSSRQVNCTTTDEVSTARYDVFNTARICAGLNFVF